MHKICFNRKIRSAREKIYPILWDIKNWTQFWSPVHKVEILYDDGRHQDFVMFLDWQATETYIRTIRFLDDKGNIAFFSPASPAPMVVHQGLWQLTTSNYQETELTAVRWFKLSLVEKETPEEYQKRLKHFSESFSARLENLLKHLGELCEQLMSSS